MIAASKLSCTQHFMIPTPESPKPVPQPTKAGFGPVQVPDGLVAPVGVPPNKGAAVNAFALMRPPPGVPASPLSTRDSRLPEVARGTPDLQFPVFALQLTGVESSARSTGPVAGRDAPYNRVASLPLAPSVILKGKPSWMVVTPETPHPPRAFS